VTRLSPREAATARISDAQEATAATMNSSFFANALPARVVPPKKRLFDLAVTAIAAPVLIVAFVLASVTLLIFEGRPVFYVSTRRVFRHSSTRVPKFRTMVRNADRIHNRATVPVTGQRFLNTSFDSPLYTRIGRFYEKACLTELPQVGLVLSGRMCVVGNRPLPENVIDSLREEHPDVEKRFDMPSGLTGPVQLVGRTYISDSERLRLEVAYCRLCSEHYRMWLDFNLLLRTVLIAARLRRQLSVDEVMQAMEKWASTPKGGSAQPSTIHAEKTQPTAKPGATPKRA